MSRRQFNRAFRARTGATPARMVERLRADLARGHIETTAEPVERVAEAVDFGDGKHETGTCLGKWRATQNKTANSYAIEITT
ncbi:transcriptional regulator GlxA family with amidase domain [Bradyrhizobium sp. JR4.1]|uniref:helix-turn-helix domain-containing protein n=1 Tax=Bradyrhizobium sp. JR4.1 TaxID=3156372 RepID=UPI003390F277